jgi:hypothetical protein
VFVEGGYFLHHPQQVIQPIYLLHFPHLGEVLLFPLHIYLQHRVQHHQILHQQPHQYQHCIIAVLPIIPDGLVEMFFTFVHVLEYVEDGPDLLNFQLLTEPIATWMHGYL